LVDFSGGVLGRVGSVFGEEEIFFGRVRIHGVGRAHVQLVNLHRNRFVYFRLKKVEILYFSVKISTCI
jgi:hypothetical protein